MQKNQKLPVAATGKNMPADQALNPCNDTFTQAANTEKGHTNTHTPSQLFRNCRNPSVNVTESLSAVFSLKPGTDFHVGSCLLNILEYSVTM